MSCTYRNAKAERSYVILANAFRDTITASVAMGRNNGYSMEEDRFGNPSQLYKEILEVVQNEGLAHALKSTIYKDTFINEPTMNEFSGMTEEQRKIKSKEYTRTSMREAVYQDAYYVAKRNTPRARQVRKILDDKGNVIPNQIFSLHAAQTATIINEKYGQKIAEPDGTTVRILLTDEMVTAFLRDQVQKEHAKITSKLVEKVKNKKKQTATQTVINFEEQNDYSDYDLIDSVQHTDVDQHFMHYVSYLEHDKKKLNHRLNVLRQKKKLMYGNRKKARLIINDIVRIKQQINKIDDNIKLLQTGGLAGQDLVEAIQDMAREDMNRVRKLIEPPPDNKGRRPHPNDEDLLEAKDILDWYQLLGNFEKKGPHPFFANNTTYDNKEIIDILKGVANDAAKIEDLLNSKIKKKTHERLTSHKNYDKLGLDISMEELFDAEVADIDFLSAYGLNPNFTFHFGKNSGDNLIAQLMSEYYTETLSKKDGFVKNKIARIDSLIGAVKKIIGNDYSIFYQKDEDGNATPYLIDLFSTQWYGFLRAVGKVDAPTRAETNRKRYKYIDKNADFIDVAILPEVHDAFGHLYEGMKVNPPSDEQKETYKKQLIERLGEAGYKNMVDRQIQQIDEYILRKNAIINQKVADHEASSVNSLPLEERKFIIRFDLENNPFKHKAADENGNISAKYSDESFNTPVSSQYIQYIPKTDDTSGFINEDFQKIKSDPTLSAFWQVLSESLLYTNGVFAASGEQVNFNSLFDMEMSVWKMILKSKFNMESYKKIFTKIRDNLIRKVTVNDGAFVQKDASETTVDTAKLKSLKAKVARKNAAEMKYLNRLLKINKATDNMVVYIDGKVKDFLDETLTDQQYEKLLANSKDGKTTYGEVKDAVFKSTQKRIMDNQTIDIPKMVKVNLTHAARIDASQEAIPVLRIMKNFYTNLKSGRGQDELRTNANKRINHWYDRVVRGYFGSKGLPFGNKVLTSDEKKKARRIKELLQIAHDERPILDGKKVQETDKEKQLKAELAELGKPRNAAFVFSALQTWMITWAMSYNLKSGAFNLFYGYYQNAYFDNLGTYWTPGNAQHAFHFVLGKGRKNLYWAGKQVGAAQAFGWKQHAEEITKAELLMNKLAIIQDMRNEQQKASERLGKSDFNKKLSPYYVSITAVEWRNQSTTILATLMDKEVENMQTHEMVQVFDGKKFNIYDEVDDRGVKRGETVNGLKSKGGILRLKDEYRYNKDGTENTGNIDNWEKMIGSDFTAFKVNAMNAVVAAHGDYSNTGGMMIKDTAGGKLGMTFLTFLPMLLHGRWGAGINLAAGTKRDKAVYRSAPASIAGLGIGILTGTLFGPVVGLTLGVGAGLVRGRMKSGKPKTSKWSEKRKAKRDEHPAFEDKENRGDLALDYAFELLTTLRAYGAATLNIPLKFVRGTEVVTINPEKTYKASPEDARAIKAILFELGFVTNFMIMKALSKWAFYCEEETPECEAKTAKKNWLANNLNRAMDDMMLSLNLKSAYETVMLDGSFMRTITNMGDWLIKYGIYMYDDTEDVITSGEFVGQSKLLRATDKLLLPSIIKSTGVATFDNPYVFMTNKYEWKLPNEAGKDFELGGDIIEEMFLKSDIVKVEEIIASQRASYGADLKKQNKRRKTKWSDYEITKLKDKKYPTLKKMAKDYQKRYGANWKKHFDKKVEQILKDN